MELEESQLTSVCIQLTKISSQFNAIATYLSSPQAGKRGYVITFVAECPQINELQSVVIHALDPIRNGRIPEHYLERIRDGRYDSNDEASVIKWGSPHMANQSHHISLARYDSVEQAANSIAEYERIDSPLRLDRLTFSQVSDTSAQLIREFKLNA